MGKQAVSAAITLAGCLFAASACGEGQGSAIRASSDPGTGTGTGTGRELPKDRIPERPDKPEPIVLDRVASPEQVARVPDDFGLGEWPVERLTVQQFAKALQAGEAVVVDGQLACGGYEPTKMQAPAADRYFMTLGFASIASVSPKSDQVALSLVTTGHDASEPFGDVRVLVVNCADGSVAFDAGPSYGAAWGPRGLAYTSATDGRIRVWDGVGASTWGPSPGAHGPKGASQLANFVVARGWIGDELIATEDTDGPNRFGVDVLAINGPDEVRSVASGVELMAVGPSGLLVQAGQLDNPASAVELSVLGTDGKRVAGPLRNEERDTGGLVGQWGAAIAVPASGPQGEAVRLIEVGPDSLRWGPRLPLTGSVRPGPGIRAVAASDSALLVASFATVGNGADKHVFGALLRCASAKCVSTRGGGPSAVAAAPNGLAEPGSELGSTEGKVGSK